MRNATDHDGALVVELDHGKVNVLDLALLNSVIEAFHSADKAQPVVVTGAGRAFSAGVDLRRIVDGGPAYTAEFLDALSCCFLTVFDHPARVVAAINGAAIAGGCVIAAACDRRLISRGAIDLTELAVGVPFPTSALEIMRGLLGPRAADLVLSARMVDADAALAIRLVVEVVLPRGAPEPRSRACEVMELAACGRVLAHQAATPAPGPANASPPSHDR